MNNREEVRSEYPFLCDEYVDEVINERLGNKLFRRNIGFIESNIKNIEALYRTFMSSGCKDPAVRRQQYLLLTANRHKFNELKFAEIERIYEAALSCGTDARKKMSHSRKIVYETNVMNTIQLQDVIVEVDPIALEPITGYCYKCRNKVAHYYKMETILAYCRESSKCNICSVCKFPMDFSLYRQPPSMG